MLPGDHVVKVEWWLLKDHRQRPEKPPPPSSTTCLARGRAAPRVPQIGLDNSFFVLFPAILVGHFSFSAQSTIPLISLCLLISKKSRPCLSGCSWATLLYTWAGELYSVSEHVCPFFSPGRANSLVSKFQKCCFPSPHWVINTPNSHCPLPRWKVLFFHAPSPCLFSFGAIF